MAELIERLAGKYGCQVDLYAERVDGLPLRDALGSPDANQGAIYWHKVPAIPGPHIVRFLAWLFLNAFFRRRQQRSNGSPYDLVLSPGINCLHPDVVIVHALFCRLQELARSEEAPRFRGGILRYLHRRLYYGLLSLLERRVYTNQRVTLAAVSRRTSALVAKHFLRRDVAVVPNGVAATEFSPAKRLARRPAARRRGPCAIRSMCFFL